MRKIFLGFMYLLLTSIIVQTKGALPQGMWKVAQQITIVKNTDSKNDTPCPKKWNIKDSKNDCIVLCKRSEKNSQT